MMLPMKKLEGQIPPNNLTDEKDKYNGIDDNTAKVSLVDAIYIHVGFWSKHELSQSSQQY